MGKKRQLKIKEKTLNYPKGIEATDGHTSDLEITVRFFSFNDQMSY